MQDEFSNDGLIDQNILREDLWDRKRAARFLGVSPDTLAVWDCTGRYHLAPVKLGRNVRYRPSKIIAFLKEQQEHGRLKKAVSSEKITE